MVTHPTIDARNPPQAATGAARVPALPQQLPSLDVLRGLAILLVLAHNLEQFDGPAGWLLRSIELMSNIGWVGVQLFFVLSGFLITRALLATQNEPHYYRAFYGRRTLRIFPLYYATLAFLFIVLPLLGHQPDALRDDRALPLWLYVSNWTSPFGLGGTSVPHFWSLAVEEQFYLVWPFVVHRRTPAQVVRLSLIVAALTFVVRAVLVACAVDAEAIYQFTISRIDALVLGAGVAAYLSLPQGRARALALSAWLLPAAAALALLGLFVTHGYPAHARLDQLIGYGLLAVVFALLVAAGALADTVTPGRIRALPGQAVLRLFGKYSYAIYVFHKPLHDYVGKPWLQAEGLYHSNRLVPALGYVVVVAVISLLAAMLSYHLFEKHFLALKDRWFAVPATA